MSVDKYAVCPCGSGKKIKFCKCKESVSELDQIGTMIEGGQIVPALDRLATMLSGGNSGEPAVVPGKPDQSFLLKLIQHKERGKEMPPDDSLSEEEIKHRVLADEKTKKWTEGKSIKKVIVVPHKLVNVVVTS